MADENATERQRLEDIAGDSWYAKGVNGASVAYSARIFSRHFRGGDVLELGPAEGVMTETLARAFDRLTLVDGSEQFVESLRERFPDAEVVRSLFEDYAPTKSYDGIILGHVLEHVEDPSELLTRAKDWLKPDGSIFAAVPNARSLHRQAAVMLGMLGEEHEMNDTDRHHGHRRVYDPESFRHDFLAAGMKIKLFGGYWLKPLSNAQLDATWTPETVETFMALGERYPDIAGEIYVIAGV